MDDRLPPQHHDSAASSASSATPMTSESSSWSFVDALPQEQQQQPQQHLHRHSSRPTRIPAASIFGSGRSPSPEREPLTISPPPSNQPTYAPLLPAADLPELSHRHADPGMSVDSRLLPRVEKDVDDPTTPLSSRRGARRAESTTLTTLSRLFAVQAATSPEQSRNPSYTLPARQPFSYSRYMHSTGIAALPDHMYTRGFLGGRHSDITVHAFGQEYKLHRLVLDRSPFFSSALTEPWLEANSKEMRVHPEDIDSSITQASFELALKRLYGACNFDEEDCDPIGLFATGCWLEMQDLIDSAVESMLRQMTPETLSPLIKLVTGNYYGRAGDKVLASAKSMLCRDGWQMPLRNWDGIPGDIIREIVGGDGFYIDGEWDRWVLAKRILDRRLRTEAIANGLIETGSRRRVQKVPEAESLMAVRFDSVYRRSNSAAGRGVPEVLQKWINLYTHPDIEPLLVLLDEGIHYLHLDFEQLQFIRQAKDSIGLPIIPEKVISNALWQQMELRQKVMNAREIELELGLSTQCIEDPSINTSRDTTMSITTSTEAPRAKGKKRITDGDEESGEIDSGSWDGNGKPRKFWIPSSDCNIVMGGNADPIIATPHNTSMQRHASRLSATLQPEDVQWAADFAAFTSQPRPPPIVIDGASPGQSGPTTVSYSHFPPFRFAAEFPNPRMLKEKKRVYSRTVFYAGSLWNIYIQKVASSRSKQLGVYLHRAKERETEEVIAGTAGLAQGSVDERIGQLEREMLLRGERRERRQRRQTATGLESIDADGAESSASGGVEDTTILQPAVQAGSATAIEPRASAVPDLLQNNNQKTGQTDVTESPIATAKSRGKGDHTTDSEVDSDQDSEDERLAAASSAFHVPTLPPYVDARPQIRTYFKIYSPSRGGRMLSVYESAPDKFNFSQSWGWKSSTLMLDEGLLSDEDDLKDDPDIAIESGRRRTMNKGDGRLRFMVVIGNI